MKNIAQNIGFSILNETALGAGPNVEVGQRVISTRNCLEDEWKTNDFTMCLSCNQAKRSVRAWQVKTLQRVQKIGVGY